jgi:hypothetical protein
MSWWSAGIYGSRMHALASEIRAAEKGQLYERVAWKRIAVPLARDSNLPETEVKKGRRLKGYRIFGEQISAPKSTKKNQRLDYGIFRAYQAITEPEFYGDSLAYTCAIEEHATLLMSGQICGL